MKVIAEIGCNHKGDFEIAAQMVRVLKDYCNVDAVKFQKRCNKELLSEEQYNAPHPVPENSYGQTYGEHREFLEFHVDEHKRLKELCHLVGVEYSTSVWDVSSAKEINIHVKPPMIKIPSACNNNNKLLEYLCENYDGEIHVSTGMTTTEEFHSFIKLFKETNRSQDLVIYHCISGYPVDFEDCHMLEIKNLLQYKYDGKCKAVGFSGHHRGIAIDNMAVALGAEYLERHFTMDRTWKGTDHAASLEPDGMRKLVRDIRACEKALTGKGQGELEVEKANREKLKFKI